MKALILASLLATPAFAAEDLCKTYLPCGSFSGPVFESLDSKATPEGEEHFTVTAEGGIELLTMSQKDKNGEELWTVQYKVVPGAGQSFQLIGKAKDGSGDRFAATGLCGVGRCTYASRPEGTDLYSAVGVISFKGDQVTRSFLIQNAAGEAEIEISRMKRN